MTDLDLTHRHFPGGDGADAFMRLSLALAKRGLGQTWPNPSVGATVVSAAGSILSCANTARGGRPHAEAIALQQAGAAAAGGTLYVTLEPCSHYGVTPPCADTVIQAGVRKVVYGLADPDPRVSGLGIERMRAAGIDVIQGPYRDEARWLALGHALRVTQKRPVVQVKLAVGSDGLVPAGNGAPVWVSCDSSRAFAHLLRAQADAIAVGAGTVHADNPQLTCRLPGLDHRSPVRVVFASSADVPPESRLFDAVANVPVWIMAGDRAPGPRLATLRAAGAEIIPIATEGSTSIPVRAALNALAERGITRLFVEGGPTLARAFLDAGVTDEIIIFNAAKRAGTGGLLPFGKEGLEKITQMPNFQPCGERRIDGDVIRFYRRSLET